MWHKIVMSSTITIRFIPLTFPFMSWHCCRWVYIFVFVTYQKIDSLYTIFMPSLKRYIQISFAYGWDNVLFRYANIKFSHLSYHRNSCLQCRKNRKRIYIVLNFFQKAQKLNLCLLPHVHWLYPQVCLCYILRSLTHFA